LGKSEIVIRPYQRSQYMVKWAFLAL